MALLSTNVSLSFNLHWLERIELALVVRFVELLGRYAKVSVEIHTDWHVDQPYAMGVTYHEHGF